VLSGMLTPGSAQRLLARLAEVTEEFVRHHHADASAPFAQRELLTLLVAARPWEMGFMRELRRAPSSAPAARTVVRSGKKLRS
jgi:hypothetical protein